MKVSSNSASTYASYDSKTSQKTKAGQSGKCNGSDSSSDSSFAALDSSKGSVTGQNRHSLDLDKIDTSGQATWDSDDSSSEESSFKSSHRNGKSSESNDDSDDEASFDSGNSSRAGRSRHKGGRSSASNNDSDDESTSNSGNSSRLGKSHHRGGRSSASNTNIDDESISTSGNTTGTSNSPFNISTITDSSGLEDSSIASTDGSNTTAPITSNTVSSGVKLGVPAYGAPDGNSFWDQVQNAKPGSIFIMNPNSGPGNQVDPTYKAAVEAAHAKGVKIYGYVSTQYGNRSASDVNSDINAYKSGYGVDGIFLDEAQLDSQHLSYYKSISDNLHQSGIEVAANPGQPDIDPAAASFTDHIMNFEGSYSDYMKTQFPEWTKSVSPDKLWNVVYDTPSNVDMQGLINKASQNNAGYIYATDDSISDGNPWDQVPSFFKQELQLTA